MPAPEGNQYAVGHGEGRPPLDLNWDEEFEELTKWALKPDSLIIRAFAPARGYSHRTLERKAPENEDFCRKYNIALELIGARRELMYLVDLSPCAFQRYATYYDKSLQAHERDDKEHAAKIETQQQANLINFNANFGHSEQVLSPPVSEQSDKCPSQGC